MIKHFDQVIRDWAGCCLKQGMDKYFSSYQYDILSGRGRICIFLEHKRLSIILSLSVPSQDP